MNRLTCATRRRAAEPVVAAALGLTLLAASTTAGATLAGSTFDTDAEGWVGWSCLNPGLCALGAAGIPVEHLAAGGNPGGYIRTQDPSSGTAARLQAPATLTSVLAVGQTLHFDVIIEQNGGGGVLDDGVLAAGVAPVVAIESTIGTLVYGAPLPNLPDELDTWLSYAVPLFDTPDWRIVDGLTLRPLAPGEFADALANLTGTGLTLIGEWLKDAPELDTGGIDNVHVVPLPGALALLLPAVAALGLAGRRRPR